MAEYDYFEEMVDSALHNHSALTEVQLRRQVRLCLKEVWRHARHAVHERVNELASDIINLQPPKR